MTTPEVEKICEQATEHWIAAGTGNDPTPFFVRAITEAIAQARAPDDTRLTIEWHKGWAACAEAHEENKVRATLEVEKIARDYAERQSDNQFRQREIVADLLPLFAQVSAPLVALEAEWREQARGSDADIDRRTLVECANELRAVMIAGNGAVYKIIP